MIFRLRLARRRPERLLTLGLAAPESRTAAAPPPAADSSEFDGFHACLLSQKAPWAGVAASTVLHWGLLAATVLVMSRVASQAREARIEMFRHTEPLRLLLPEPLYFSPAANRRGDSHEANEKSSGGRKIQLPEVAHNPRSRVTLLQPRSPADLILETEPALPSMVFWSAPAIESPARKEFVLPGREKLAAVPDLSAPPELRPPDPAAMLAGLPIPQNPNAPPQPRLPVQPGGSMPVRIFSPPAEWRAAGNATMDRLPGRASAVIALSDDPPPLSPEVTVPSGNQIGRMLLASGQVPYGPSEGGPQGNGANAAGGSGGPGEGGRETPGQSGGDGRGRIRVFPEPPRNTNPAGGVAAGSSGQSFAGIAGGVPVQIVHPENGRFDVVVVQSTTAAGTLSDRHLLSGSPIYTAYLRLGIPKEWLLHYCIAKSSEARSSGNIIQLGNFAPLTAPFPRTTIVPSMEWSAKAGRVVVHGYLTAAGQFRDLTMAEGQTPDLFIAVKPFLEQWLFRPASQDGRPVEVEILLVIPG